MKAVTLWQGDCLELMKNIPDGSVDLTVTSPPYDNLRTYNGNIDQWNFEKFKAIAKELFRVTAAGVLLFGLLQMPPSKGVKREHLSVKHCGLWSADLICTIR